MKEQSIAEGFASYSAVALPDDAPQIQKVEVQRAFYAGAVIVFTRMLDASDLEEGAAEAAMTALQQEIDDYVSLLKAKPKNQH